MATAATSFSAALAQLAKQTVTLRTVTRANAYAEESAVSTANYSAYVQRVNSADRDIDTDGKVVEFRAYIPHTTLTVSLNDELVVDSVTRRVIEVDYRYDEHGQQVVVVGVGRR